MGETFNAPAWLVDRHLNAGLGDRIAYRCSELAVTYSTLASETWRAARMLHELGVEPGDRVLMLVLDEPAFPALYLGAMRVGAVAVPVSTMLRPHDVAVIAADAIPRVVIASRPLEAHMRAALSAADSTAGTGSAACIGVLVDTELGAHPLGTAHDDSRHDMSGVLLWSNFADSREIPSTPTDYHTPGFWLYTSGTTGQPKGAVHTHGDIKGVTDTYARSVLAIGPDDVCYSVAKLFFAFGLGNCLFFPLSVGASAVIDPRPPTPAIVADMAVRHRPTLFFSPPGFCAALVDSAVPADTFASLRATVTAGETLPAEVYRRFKDRFGVEMLDGIGSTEALHIFISNHPGDVRPGSTGRVVDGYEVRLTDDQGDEIRTADARGALWVRGPSVTQGYWARPETNKTTFLDSWCRTGDVYRRDEEGYYFFVGRNSDMIKTGGIWVSPAEVEAALIEHPGVLEAAVVGGRSAEGLETTVAFVVAAAGHQIDTATLIAHCKQRLASFKRPREIFVVDSLPKTATGKIQRFALRTRLEGEMPPAATNLAPSE